MTGTKTVAERLRNAEGLCATHGFCRVVLHAISGEAICPLTESCEECKKGILRALAHQIEAEQAQSVSKALIEEAAKQENMDSVLLYNAAKDLQENAHIIKESVLEDLAHFAGLIRKALKGAKPQLPEGVIWPTYEDGELVKFGDEVTYPDGLKHEVKQFWLEDGKYLLGDSLFGLKVGGKYSEPVKRPEPEVLDADGVPIKVGDTVYHEDEGECVVERIYRQNGDTLLDLDVCGAIWNTGNVKPSEVTHRKPDTLESIFSEMVSAIESGGCVDLAPYVERYRKLKGGE